MKTRTLAAYFKVVPASELNISYNYKSVAYHLDTVWFSLETQIWKDSNMQDKWIKMPLFFIT